MLTIQIINQYFQYLKLIIELVKYNLIQKIDKNALYLK